tara:strand:- start:37 stop:228 length:192 start_codon:yes stop_codon:yes gene_type:complete
MGKLKWAKELAKKGGSKVTDIQKGTKPKGERRSTYELEFPTIDRVEKKLKIGTYTDRQYLKDK